MQRAGQRAVCSEGRLLRYDCLRPFSRGRSSWQPLHARPCTLAGHAHARGHRVSAGRQTDAPLQPFTSTAGLQKAVKLLQQPLELGAMLALASSAAAGAAYAAAGDGLAKSLSDAVPDSVATTMAPMVERTSAIIPGLVGDSPVREGIVSGFLLILFSELGDKTFFLAVLLALKESKSIVFAGTFGALAVMTVISVALGQLLHQVDELGFAGNKLPLDDYLAVALLIFFGVKTILDARDADESAAEEREEAEEEVSRLSSSAAGVFLSTFTLVFAAEWGDKSFLATIALAAASSPVGVVLGAIGGHGFATGIAVAGGSVLGKYLNEKVVQYLGGSLFLVFAAATIADIVRGK